MKVITKRQLEETRQRTRESTRGRLNLNLLEETDAANAFSNFLLHLTPVAAHRHPEKVEAFRWEEGVVLVVEFTDGGEVTEAALLDGEDAVECAIAPNIYHSIIVLSEEAEIFEVKPGPYDKNEKEFAPWSPAEDDPKETWQAFTTRICQKVAQRFPDIGKKLDPYLLRGL